MNPTDNNNETTNARPEVSVHEVMKDPGMQKTLKKMAIVEANWRIGSGALQPDEIAAQRVDFAVPTSRMFGPFVAHNVAGSQIADSDTDDPVIQIDLDTGDSLHIRNPGPGHYDPRDS